jgi:hypothetical protein
MQPMEQGVGTKYEWVPFGLVHKLERRGGGDANSSEQPNHPAPPPFLPSTVMRQRYVRHPFDIEGWKVLTIYSEALQLHDKADAAAGKPTRDPLRMKRSSRIKKLATAQVPTNVQR